MAKRKTFNRDLDFQRLAEKINDKITENDGLIGDQKEQVELMLSLERKFQYFIQKYQQTFKIYAKFMDYIRTDVGNILSAQPYFRERGVVFKREISSKFKNHKFRDLGDYKINYNLIEFIVENWKGELPERPKKYYEEYIKARKILIENNIPLAINRAKIFFKSSQDSHLKLMDLIGICTQGLIVGIDKYGEDKYDKRWRSVCIGRMVAYMIEENSRTVLQMPPEDRRILYRANSLRKSLKLNTIEELHENVNRTFLEDRKKGKKTPKLPVDFYKIQSLINSYDFDTVEVTITTDDGEAAGSLYEFTDSNVDTEENVAQKEAFGMVRDNMEGLALIERKVIKLKGVDL